MIYFVQQGRRGAIKIGYTGKSKPASRITGLQVANARRLRLLLFMHGCLKSEAALHSRFAYARIRGEWFRPVPELLDHIDRMRGTKHPRRRSLLRRFLRQHDLERGYDGRLPTLWRMAAVLGAHRET